MFVEKLNKKEEGVYVIEEEKTISNGMWEGHLDHDNVDYETISIHTEPNFQGREINNFFVSTPSETPWKAHLRIFSDTEKVYVTYESHGDQVEADDINQVQNVISDTVGSLRNLEGRTNTLEETKANITYVDTQLNTKYDKDEVFTKEEVLQEIENIIDTAPEALDTLGKIAQALNDDPDFAATITNELSQKVDKVSGKKLTDENYTLEEKNKLAGIESGAEVNEVISVNDMRGSVVLNANDVGAETPTGAQNRVNAHANLTDNPHNTTKEQIGLSNVTNVLQASKQEFNIHSGDNEIHVTPDERSDWNAKSNLALGESSSTAYRGDRGKVAYDHSQSPHAPSNAQKNSDITKAEIEAKLTGNITSHRHDEYVTQDDLGDAGLGDMLKSEYDTNNNGKVDVAETAESVDWTHVQGKPTSYPPSSHTHSISDVSELQSELNAKETPAGAQNKVDARLSESEKANLLSRNSPVTWNDLKGGG